jgi:hypothetical protein
MFVISRTIRESRELYADEPIFFMDLELAV